MESFRWPKPGGAYAVINSLNDEMIRYELESQGVKSVHSFIANKKTLTELIDSRKYKPGHQPVALGYVEDIARCSAYMLEWEEKFEKSNKNKATCESYLNKLMFLALRLSYITPADADEESKRVLSSLKLSVKEFQKKILSILNPNSGSDLTAKRVIQSIDNWTLHPESLGMAMLNGSRRDEPTVSKAGVTKERGRADDSILDLSLSMVEGHDRTKHVDRDRVINSTTRPPNARETFGHEFCDFDSNQNHRSSWGQTLRYVSPYKPNKVQIWKWGLKFLGEPDTLAVVEFIRRVRELAKARGASKSELFDGACDLFDGSALKWFRTGVSTGLFTNWDELESELMEDFKAYDYGDNLWDYIRGRIQRPNERVVTYFAVMEDLFLKLNRPASEVVKVHTIHRNLRADILRGLGITELDSVHELKQMCKTIEKNLKRISERDHNFQVREPSTLPKSVRFSGARVNMMSDYDRYERELDRQDYRESGNNFYEYPCHSMDDHEREIPNDRERESSRSWGATARQHLDRYEPVCERQWERNMGELSIRVPPNQERIPVPDSRHYSGIAKSYSSPHHGNHSNYYSPPNRTSSRNSEYVPLHRNNNNVSENSNWGSKSRTNPIPTMIRRPFQK